MKRKRLECAKRYQSWTAEKCSQVLKNQLYGNLSHVYHVLNDQNVKDFTTNTC